MSRVSCPSGPGRWGGGWQCFLGGLGPLWPLSLWHSLVPEALEFVILGRSCQRKWQGFISHFTEEVTKAGPQRWQFLPNLESAGISFPFLFRNTEELSKAVVSSAPFTGGGGGRGGEGSFQRFQKVPKFGGTLKFDLHSARKMLVCNLNKALISPQRVKSQWGGRIIAGVILGTEFPLSTGLFLGT